MISQLTRRGVARIDRCTKDDFHYIIENYAAFWPHDRARALHHPILLNEFGNTAFVIREGRVPVAYLFGFFSQSEPAGYVHVVAVHPAHRNKSLATQLYEHFSEVAAAHGCRSLKAITHPSNSGSIRFHRRIGMQLMGVPNEDGIPVVRDYSGPGEDRVVFRKEISPGRGGEQAARAEKRKR